MNSYHCDRTRRCGTALLLCLALLVACFLFVQHGYVTASSQVDPVASNQLLPWIGDIQSWVTTTSPVVHLDAVPPVVDLAATRSAAAANTKLESGTLLTMPWVSGGPNGASIRSLAVSPAYTQDHTVFAGSWGSGVYRLNDLTGEWEKINHGLEVPRIMALAVSPAFSVDKKIFVSLHGGGVYTSADQGGNWIRSDSGLPIRSVRALAVSPAYANDRTLYAGLNGSGTYRSQDGANSWSPITAGIGLSTVIELDIAPTFSNTGLVYARTDDYSLYRADDGANWIRLTDLPSGHRAWSIALSPDSSTLFVGTCNGVVTSTDQGLSWSVANTGIEYVGIDDLVASPAFAADHTVWACSSQNGIYRSINAGGNWTKVFTGTDFSCAALAVSPAFDTDRVIFAGSSGGSGGVYRSLNAGDQWQRRGNGMTWSVLTLAPSPDYRNDQTIFAGLNGGGIFRSNNRGASWEPAKAGYAIGGDAVAIALSPQYKDDGTLFATGYGTGIMRSTDRGQVWHQVSLTDVYALVEIAISPQSLLTQSLLLAGSVGQGAFRSNDGGSTWAPITQGLVVSSPINFEFSPAYAGDHTIFVATDGDGLLRSQDMGASWTRLVTGFVGSYVWALAVSPNYAADHTVLASTSEGLFRSQDNGDTWVTLPFTTSFGVVELAFSPHFAQDRTIWAVTTGWSLESTGGVFISEDGGDNWRQINAGLTQRDHRAVASADRGGTSYDIFVGTTLQSVWQRYSDIDLLVRARGEPADGVWPRMQVRVNDQTVADWFVNTLEYALWMTQTNLIGQDQIDVWYSNDAWVSNQDRNLYVDYVQVHSATVRLDESFVVFDQADSTSTDLEAFDGLLATEGQQTALNNGGALRFGLGITPALVQLAQGHLIRKVMSDTWINDDARPSWAQQWDAAIGGNALSQAVLVWRDDRNGHDDIYAQRLVTTGTLGGNFRINDDVGWNHAVQPDVLVNNDGSFVAVWSDQREASSHQIWGQRYDSSGIAVGNNFSVTVYYSVCHVYPAVAGRGDGSFLIVWSEDWSGDIWGQRYNAAGTPVGTRFKVNGTLDINARRRHARVAVADDDHFLVVWQDPRNGDMDIYGQWYDAAGNAVGGNFRINDDAGLAEQVTPAVAVSDSGIFVVTWRDKRRGHEDVYAQRFGPARDPLGGNFRANDDPGIAQQHAPRVAVAPSGEFVLAWWDLRSVGPDVYAQYYDRLGNAVEANFKIDESTGYQEYGPDVTMGDMGKIWFGWYGQKDDYLDIYVNRWELLPSSLTTVTISGSAAGQIGIDSLFTATITPITATMPVTYTWEGTNQTPIVHSNRMSTTDTVTFAWSTTGTKTITVTAVNPGGAAADTHLIAIDASPQSPDTYEPNDTCPQAYFVNAALGSTTALTSYISRADDVDLYRLELLQPYTVISITHLSPANAESTLGLFDGPCVGGLPRAWSTPLRWNLPRAWSTGHGSSKTLWYNIGPYTGTYYIQANGVNSEWSTQPYSLNIATWLGVPGFDLHEINDTCDVATPVQSGQTITGYIFPISDTDHFSLTITQPSTQVMITVTSVYSYDLDLYDGCVNGVPAAYNTPRAWSTDRTATVKSIAYNVGPYTGTYYVEVYGFNGGNNADNANELEVNTRVVPVSDTQTLILLNRQRLQTYYGNLATDALIGKLQQLAAQPSVNGQLIMVDDDPLVLAAYNQWVATNPERANDVSTAIKTLLLSELGRYPNLEYIVIVGSDRVIPFRRVFDRSLFREYSYIGYGNILPNNATGAAFYNNYFLTDDFYGDRSPTFWQGHDLYIPDFAVGRLAETPQEIMAFIDTFLAGQATFANTSLVAGYDFVIDVSHVISDQLKTNGSIDQQTLIGNNWNSIQFSQALLQNEVDVASINVHADHWGLGTPQDIGLDSSAILAATVPMSRSVYFTLGCHSGLNIPDQDGNPHTVLDLPQTFLRRGANWIGNTGYGIGGDGLPLSEQLMLMLSQELTQGDQQLIGPALVRAKQRYYTSLPPDEFGFNDEKVMSEIVLYGLPMYTLETIPALRHTVSEHDMVATEWQSVGPCPDRQGRTYYLQTSPVTTDIGVYYRALNVGLNGGTQARPDQPVQPRLADTVDVNVRGIVFEGGAYTSYSAFDPVVTRLGDSDKPLGAETTLTTTQWWPARLVTLSRLDTLAGTQKRVVALPGQYRGSDALQRVYQQMTVTLYASTSSDWLPPTITNVTQTIGPTSAPITVTATDNNGICRVIATYTSGQGEWQSIDLAESGGGVWRTTIPLQPAAEYFIQAVDLGGNVTVDDNQGRYYFATARRVYLPVIVR